MSRPLTLSEAGERLGYSRTWVREKVEQRLIKAVIDPITGKKCITEQEMQRLENRFRPYDPVPETEVSEPSEAG